MTLKEQYEGIGVNAIDVMHDGTGICIPARTFLFRRGCSFYNSPFCGQEGHTNHPISLSFCSVFLRDAKPDGILHQKFTLSCTYKVAYVSSFTYAKKSGPFCWIFPWSRTYGFPCGLSVMFQNFSLSFISSPRRAAVDLIRVSCWYLWWGLYWRTSWWITWYYGCHCDWNISKTIDGVIHWFMPGTYYGSLLWSWEGLFRGPSPGSLLRTSFGPSLESPLRIWLVSP